jgi:hypothetical protein
MDVIDSCGFARSGVGSQGSRVSAFRRALMAVRPWCDLGAVVGGLRESTLASDARFAVELEPANAGVQVTMTVDSMHDQVWTARLLAGRANELDNLAHTHPERR